MLVINYNGNKPITDYFKYSVQGNNNADRIRFLVSLNQEGLVFDENYHYYAKVQSVDDDFYDKVECSEIEFDDSENLLKVEFALESKHTSHRQIEVSLACENIESEIVWQTQLVKVAIANAVNSEEEIENNYPTILAQLQQQIDDLKKQGGGGAGKYISLEIMPNVIVQYGSEGFKPVRKNVRLQLHNFSNVDVGTYIYLFHYSNRPHKKKLSTEISLYLNRGKCFKHPANYDSNSRNIKKLGYGTLAGEKVFGWADTIFTPDVPNFMPHNGFVQTEYEITEEHIAQGYMDIDIGREFLCLLRPYVNDPNNYDDINDEYIFEHWLCTIPRHGHFITYMQVENGEVKCLPNNMLYFYGNTYMEDMYVDMETNETRLYQGTQLKLVSF